MSELYDKIREKEAALQEEEKRAKNQLKTWNEPDEAVKKFNQPNDLEKWEQNNEK